jgi:Secretion system C-terminal sorting domain/Galactose oxidase, central domain
MQARHSAQVIAASALVSSLAFAAPTPCAASVAPPRLRAADVMAGAWSELPPLARTGHTVVYDPIRDRLLLFGGTTGNPPTRGEVWTYPLATNGPWQKLQTMNDGPAREFHGAAYDPVGDRLLIFGGGRWTDATTYQEFSDVWALSLGTGPTWVQLTASGSGPSDRTRAATVYDSRRNSLVISGGTHSGTWQYDTWRLDLSGSPTWSSVATTLAPAYAPPRPAPQIRGEAVYDSSLDCMIACTENYVRDNFWALPFSGTATNQWAGFIGSCGPVDMQAYSIALDPVGQVLFGAGGTDAAAARISYVSGYPQACFTAMNWSAFPHPIDPLAGTQILIWDPVRNRPLCVAGNTVDENPSPGPQTLSQVATFTVGAGSTWTRLDSPAGVPSARYEPKISYDSQRDQVLLIGGYVDKLQQFGNANDATALWGMSLANPGSWATLADSARGTTWFGSTGLPGPSIAYDSARDRVLSPGGGAMYSFALSTATAWTPIAATGTAPSLVDGRVRYDAANDRALLVDDSLHVWSLMLTGTPAWSRIDNGSAPFVLRPDAALVLDTQQNQLVLVTQHVATNGIESPPNELWQISLLPGSAWTRVYPAGLAVPSRFGHSAIYDVSGQRMIIFGTSDDASHSEVLALSLDSSPTLTRLTAGGIAPPALDYSDAAYDPVRQRLVIFGGKAGMSSGTLWSLDLQPDAATPALASVVDAGIWNGQIQVRWQVSSSGAVTIERRSETSDWLSVRQEYPDGTGMVEFTDTSVSPGTRYGYRLRFANGSAVSVVSEVWVDVPSPSLALAAMSPNPVIGELNVRVTLPDAAHATVELLDVTGRRVSSSEVGSLGAGQHTISLTDGKHMTPGIYLVRLTHGASARTLRVAVLR